MLKYLLTIFFFIAAFIRPTAAVSYWAATNGTITGPGTSPAGPYLNMSNALYGSWSGGSLAPGDIMHFKGGTYVGFSKCDVHCNGSVGGGYITFKSATNEWAKLDAEIEPFQIPGFLIYRDLEIYNSDTARVSAQSGTFFPSDIQRHTGFNNFSPDVKLINCIIHDITRLGCYFSQLTTNFVAYGNLIYNVGWVSVDNSGEHGFYGQSAASALLKHNIIFNTTGNGFQLYASAVDPTENLVGITLDGNVEWGASALSTTRVNRDFLLGNDASSGFTDNILLKNNMFYYSHAPWTFPTSQLGRTHTNGTLTAYSNYWALGIVLNEWTNLIGHDNIFATTTNATSPKNYVVSFQHTNHVGTWAWDTNTYYTLPGGAAFATNATDQTFAQWKPATGLDSVSTFATTALPDRVVVLTNDYQSGRANVIIYNWTHANNVSVDFSLLGLTNGSGYEVHNAANYFAPVCLNGNWTSGSVSFPMTNLTVAQATGLPTLPPPTGPEFGVFIVLPLAPFVALPPATPQVPRAAIASRRFGAPQ